MKTVDTVDLWGEPVVVRVSEAKRKPTVPKGYAAPPGSGPAGQTCGTCRHRCAPTSTARTYWKCALMRAHWTAGPGSDIRVRSPACRCWEAARDEGKELRDGD